jgi:hypothetical protein
MLPELPKATDHLTDFQLSHLVNEKHPDPAGRTHLKSCPDCLARYKNMQAERDEFLNKHPLKPIEPQTKATLNWPKLAMAGSAAVIFLAVVFLYPKMFSDPDVITKGPFRIKMFVKRAEQVFQQSSLQQYRAQANDALRFEISSGQTGYLRILISSANDIKPLYPNFENEPALYKNGLIIKEHNPKEIPVSFVLDQESHQESLLFFWSSQPLEPKQTLELANKLGKKALGFSSLGNGIWLATIDITRYNYPKIDN